MCLPRILIKVPMLSLSSPQAGENYNDTESVYSHWRAIRDKIFKTDLWLSCLRAFGACWESQSNAQGTKHLTIFITWKVGAVMDMDFSGMIRISEVTKNSRLQDTELGSSRAVSLVAAKRLLHFVWLGQFSRSSLLCGRKSFTFLMEFRTSVFYSNMWCHLICRIKALGRK